jgi:hypothetical protein
MGSRVQIGRTHLKQIESFELDHALDPSLHLGSPNEELSFELFFFFRGVQTNQFSL